MVPKATVEGKLWFGLWFQRDKSHVGSEAASSRSRKLRDSISIHTQEAERVKDAVINQQSQPAMTYFLQQGCTPIAFPNSATNCSSAWAIPVGTAVCFLVQGWSLSRSSPSLYVVYFMIIKLFLLPSLLFSDSLASILKQEYIPVIQPQASHMVDAL